MFKYLIAVMLSTTISLYAWLQPAPGHFGLEGEVLWLLPSVEDRAFIFSLDSQFDADFSDERFQKNFSFHPAYRLEAAYGFCNGVNDIRLRWTAFSTTTTDDRAALPDASGTIFIDIQVPAAVDVFAGGIATSVACEESLKYYSVDALLGQYVFTGHTYTVSLQGGFQYYNLRSFEKYVYELGGFVTVNALYEDRVNGIGPELAIDFRYILPFCPWTCADISFVANAKGALLVTNNHAKLNSSINVNVIPQPSLDFENESHWRIVPEMEYQLGFNYFCYNDFCTFSFEIGYEFLSYHNCLDKVRVFDAVDLSTPQIISNLGISIDDYSDFGLHGPYLAVRFAY